MATLFVVDARSRELNCFVASATKLPNNHAALVLRKASGNIGKVEKLHGKTVEHPILVIGDYQAQSSAGFTAQLYCGDIFRKVFWVGGAGFGFSSEDEDTGKKIHRGYGLRPFGHPLWGTLIPAGARIESVETHSNSNHDTSDAAYAGLEVMVDINPNLFLLAEGQSDYTSATSFEVPEGATEPEFSDEHRAEDIFSPENMLEAGIRRAICFDSKRDNNRDGKIALRYALLRAVINANKNPDEANNFMATVPEIICNILGNEEIQRIVKERYAELVEAGWKFGFDSCFICAYSPEGEITSGSTLSGRVGEEFFRMVKQK